MSKAPDKLKIALAQLNPRVGDIKGNCTLIREARKEAAALGADLVLFSELFVTGYPPEDLVLKEAFQNADMQFPFSSISSLSVSPFETFC